MAWDFLGLSFGLGISVGCVDFYPYSIIFAGFSLRFEVAGDPIKVVGEYV